MENITSYRSLNFNGRALPVCVLMMHYTGMQSGQAALERLCDEAAQVSAHYLVEEDGRVFQLVPEDKRAWHAGKGHWRGMNDMNSVSIGIEIVNPGHEWGYRAFPKAQMQSVLELAQGILARHKIPRGNVIGHSDIAPARKEDPGELFDWAWLAEKGVGVFVSDPVPTARNLEEVAAVQRKLADYGYGIEVTGVWDEQSTFVAKAFQRHFRPAGLSGQWDSECSYLLESLLKLT